MNLKNEKIIKVLVIDPDEDFSRDVRLFLEDTYYVDTRQTIDQLDYIILLNKIDLIVMAVDYPDKNLISLLEQIRKNHKKLKIVIMYTYFSSGQDFEKSLVNYADDIITKPFDVALLKNKLDSLATATI
ncbi:MAG: response regulator [Calditrichaceae bacterium]|jgi:DNA-binding response OmpR family regulator